MVAKAPKGMVVHHIDGRSRNNEAGNLAVMTRKQHAAAHHQLQAVAFGLVQAGLIQWDGESYICSSRLERLSKRA